MTVTDVTEQPPVITSNGGGATAALSVPENQGAGREGVRPNWPSVAAPADLRRHRNRDDLGGEEATELRLLARLQELGYQVERSTSLPPEGGAES